MNESPQVQAAEAFLLTETTDAKTSANPPPASEIPPAEETVTSLSEEQIIEKLNELLKEPDRTLGVQLSLGACYRLLKLAGGHGKQLKWLSQLEMELSPQGQAGQDGNSLRNLRRYSTLVGKLAMIIISLNGIKSDINAPEWLWMVANDPEKLSQNLANRQPAITCAADLDEAADKMAGRRHTLESWESGFIKVFAALETLDPAARQPALDLIESFLASHTPQQIK